MQPNQCQGWEIISMWSERDTHHHTGSTYIITSESKADAESGCKVDAESGLEQTHTRHIYIHSSFIDIDICFLHPLYILFLHPLYIHFLHPLKVCAERKFTQT